MAKQSSDNTVINMIKEKSIPRYVFKYAKISKNLYESFLNSELWFAKPNSFNDPFDGKYDEQTNWDEDSVRTFVNTTKQFTGEPIDTELVVKEYLKNPEKYSQYVSDIRNKRLENIGLCCFSSSPRKILMWSHYADSHKGVCVKFDITKDVDLFEHTHKINYTWKYPKLNILSENEFAYVNGVLTKSKHWKYENEIRTIQMRSGLYKFKSECLKEIIFGLNSNKKEILNIKKIVNANYKNVKFKKVSFKKFSFKIKFENI